MGNCAPKPHRPPPPPSPSPPLVLSGPDSCPATSWIRAALLYKPAASAAVKFAPAASAAAGGGGGGGPVLKCGADWVTGSPETILRYLDGKFGGPVAVGTVIGNPRSVAEGVRDVVVLQHRSMERQLEGMARWAEGMVAEGGGRAAEARRVGRRYGELVEVMLEHARMEEILLFPALEHAADDAGVCKLANEEHGRDLPMMNGIKEDFKSLLAIKLGTPCYNEALLNLSSRLNTLQEHCKHHFEAEERELLPLLEVAERDGSQDRHGETWGVEEVIKEMEATHSNLFPFFMAGFLPEEALQYLHLIFSQTSDRERLVKMLQSLITTLGKPPVSSGIPTTPLKSRKLGE